MRFAKAFTTILVSATLTSIVTSSAINSKLVRRESLDDDVEADDDVWNRYSSLCGGGATKRSLEVRADMPALHDEVAMGSSKIMDSIPLGLWTKGLVTCIGLVVTGKKKGSQETVRVLGHFVGARFSLESQWQSFKEK